MNLSPRQLSSLNEMGIPVWEFRSTQSIARAITLPEKNTSSAAPSEQLLNCEWVVLIDAQNYSEQAQNLLHAMLFAMGVEQQRLAIIDSEQLAQLQQIPTQGKVLLILGDALANALSDESFNRGSIHKSFNSQLTTVHSFSLDELLTTPEYKPLAWQDLQLAKQALLQS